MQIRHTGLILTPPWLLCRDDLLIEFEATTALMKFTDDVVVQVKPFGQSGSVVNMRSRSRVGSGDWGANWKRICYLNQKAAAAGLRPVPPPAGSETKSWTSPGPDYGLPEGSSSSSATKEKAGDDVPAPKRKKSRKASSSSASKSEEDGKLPTKNVPVPADGDDQIVRPDNSTPSSDEPLCED